MDDFPKFMRNRLNRIATASQHTEDIEGYVFDGADGSQVAFWTCHADRTSREHRHDFDEYMVVLQGRCTLIIENERIPLSAGQEYCIPRGVTQVVEVVAGTRTLHVFGGQRARREHEQMVRDV